MLHLLHTISGVLLFVCLLSKMGLHYFLEWKCSRIVAPLQIIFSISMYFLPYKGEVSDSFNGLKTLCNLLMYAFYFFLTMNMVVGVLL